MKASLEFQIPDEVEAFETACEAMKVKCRIEEFSNWMRGLIKHTERETWPDLEAVRDEFWKIMGDRET